MNFNEGGNAFPYSALAPDGSKTMYADSTGMTLRDYFAAKAMQGLCGSDSIMQRIATPSMSQSEANTRLSESAYAMADAMLAAREVKL